MTSERDCLEGATLIGTWCCCYRARDPVQKLFDCTTYVIDSLFFLVNLGHAVAQLVEALSYKPEGRGFDSRWCHWNFSLT